MAIEMPVLTSKEEHQLSLKLAEMAMTFYSANHHPIDDLTFREAAEEAFNLWHASWKHLKSIRKAGPAL